MPNASERPALSDFPVHEMALEALMHGMAGAYDVDDEGNHVLVPMNGEGGEFSFHDVLHFYAGYDPSLVVAMLDEDGHEIPDVVEYTGPSYHYHDVIRALIAEVRRLRALPQ